MNNAQKKMPTEFANTIDLACSIYGKDFFTSGGCGVLAALLAEVTHAKGEYGSLYLIIRVGDGDSWLSHICFNDHISNDCYDINGGDGADEQWEHLIYSQCIENNEEDPAFEYSEIFLDSQSDIFAILKKLSSEYFLNVSKQWVENHYPDLRDRVLSAAGLGEKKFEIAS
jgi:hypothetical protein